MNNKLNLTMMVALTLGVSALPMYAADQWMKPTPEELAMTSVPGYPGAPAVILLREEITRDDLHVVQRYERIKVLNEKGKDKANVELGFVSSIGDGYDELSDDKEVTDISGRTIHADGTVIPFTGKPYLKMIQKGKDYKYQARVFTLPDVEVGSIIEYRYATRINDHVFEAPSWYLQDDLFIKTAHFAWYPTTHELQSEEGAVNSITWFPILPAGVTLVNRETPAMGPDGHPQKTFEVTAHDVAPQPEEEYMPPIKSFTYRVLFAYSPYRNQVEFWKEQGKKWSKREDSFIGPSGDLKTATQTVIGGAQTPDEKLHKIYAAVMALENTNYTRDHDRKEDQAAGLGKVSNAGDVFKRGRGSSNQLTAVFVGMARAAGMKAYVMLVPDRSKHILLPGLMSFNQFDNMIAIVNVNGKDQFFDPGERYCDYGHLAWVNTFTQGLRQADNGTDFADTPGDNYTSTKTTRLADLKMNEHGEVSGKIDITYEGSAALTWRHRALRGDEESLKNGLRTSMQEMLPKTMEVKVVSVDNGADYDKPFGAHFEVSGTVGTPTGKRMILPVDVFLASDSATFTHEKREEPVYFQYPESVLDAVRIRFPAGMSIEASPTEAKTMFQKLGQYNMAVTNTATSFTAQRKYLFNTIVVPVKDYGDLRGFYSQMETKDKDNVVLKMGAESASAAAPGGN